MMIQPSVKMKKRANVVVMLAIMIFGIAVVLKLFTVMVIDRDDYRERAEQSQFDTTITPATRGSIYSSDGKILAQSANVYNIKIDPKAYYENDAIRDETKDEAQRKKIADYLSAKLGIEKEDVDKAFEQKESRCIYLAKRVDKALANEVLNYEVEKERTLTCLGADNVSKRYYPQDSLASAVIGFTDENGIGQYGIESQYNENLAGVNGVSISATNVNGEPIPYKNSKLYEAKDGDSIVLTIDSMIQYYTETALEEACKNARAAESSCAIVMNCKTGEILAMASYPTFNLNNKGVLSDEYQRIVDEIIDPEKKQETTSALFEKMWSNRCISKITEPGSVFKVITGSAALEEKAIDPDKDTFLCQSTYYIDNNPDLVIYCHDDTGGHGVDSFEQALADSCNPAFAQIGLKLGAERFSYYEDAFGLREKTGIDLPGESSSYVAPYQNLSYPAAGLTDKLMLGTCSYGQANSITPLQMVTGYAAAVNGGYLIKPHVVSKITDSEGNTIKSVGKMVKRQVISEESSAKMREALTYVVDGDTSSHNAYIRGYKIGGKSGTAEKRGEYQNELAEWNYQKEKAETENVLFDEPEPAKDQCVASYCAFAPSDDPEIIVYVAIDEPYTGDGRAFGGTLAAPCVTQILKNTLPYLGYLPQYDDNYEEQMDIRIADVTDKSREEAEEILKEQGFEVDVRGNGDRVVKQFPKFTNSMPAGLKVIIFTDNELSTEKFRMPDLTNMTISEVEEKMNSLGLNLKKEGANTENAKVISQSIKTDKIVEEGTVVTVTFGIVDPTG